MRSMSIEMQAEYERIQKRVNEDPGTAGDQGEENWAELLRQWLPSNYKVVTKGRIIDRNGNTSPQIDVLVLRPFYPEFLVNKKLYLSAGVAAAFECKLTLKVEHINSAFSTGSILRKLLDNPATDPIHEMHSTLIYGLLAHSHNWKEEQSRPKDNINRAIKKYDDKFVTHPRECLDFICVSDLATWSTMKHLSLGYADLSKDPPVMQYTPEPMTYYGISDKEMYPKSSKHYLNSMPIGTFLALILPLIAVNDESLSDFARHFKNTGIWSSTSTIHSRRWDLSIFSDKANVIYNQAGYLYANNYIGEIP